MAPQLWYVIFWAFIIWIVRRDIKINPDLSKTLWVPTAWSLIAASRSLKEWLYGVGDISVENADLSGSSVDRYAIAIFILVGFYVLSRRSISLSSVIENNSAIALFFVYAIVSVIWSDSRMTVFTFWHR